MFNCATRLDNGYKIMKTFKSSSKRPELQNPRSVYLLVKLWRDQVSYFLGRVGREICDPSRKLGLMNAVTQGIKPHGYRFLRSSLLLIGLIRGQQTQTHTPRLG